MGERNDNDWLLPAHKIEATQKSKEMDRSGLGQEMWRITSNCRGVGTRAQSLYVGIETIE
jgi:hypothetical protein